MSKKHYSLSARVDTESPRAIGPVLEKLVAGGSVNEGTSAHEFLVKADFEGESAKDLNRWLLSSLRSTEKRTRLRSEWTASDGTTERFFDYVLKKTIKP